MSNETTTGGHAGSPQMWRWLAGGLVAGAAMLGLLVGAYAIGYDRGKDHTSTTAPATTAPATTTATGTTTQAGGGAVPATPALIARGKTLFTADGCAACHSLTGAAGAGPPLNGLAGSPVTLDDGSTVTADDAYLVESLTDSDAKIVKGYHAGVMAAAVAAHDFGQHPDEVRALVAYIKSVS
jgi:mono/diheme cytochrome c family protein